MPAPALLSIILTASHVLTADTVPKFQRRADLPACRPAALASTLPGRDASACHRDENDARTKLEQDWTQYSAAQRAQCAGFAALDRAPSYVELLTLEMAKQAKELPVESTMGAVTNRP